MMNIVKGNLSWKGNLNLLNKNNLEGIALHHMAHPSWNFEDVHAFHRDSKGWLGIGYNYWVGFDGKIIEGRGLNQGAHVLGHNDKLIGIGFQGDYDSVNKLMPEAQFNAGVELINWLKEQIPTARVVHGHSHWQPTACPGKYFPLVEMISLKKRGQEELFGKPSNWAKEAWGWAVKNNLTDGTNPKGPLTREQLITILYRYHSLK
jgi:N-acetylmuramoyl-L-alanine amidase